MVILWATAGSYLTLKYLDVIAWTNFMSLYAIIISHWAGMQGARTEEKIEEENG